MVVLLKTLGGLSVPLSNGSSITLKGNGLINQVEASIWQELKQNATIKDMLEKGYIVEGEAKQDNARADVLDKVAQKQSRDIAKQEANTKQKIKKD